MRELVCPHCEHKIIIQESVIQYVCVCGVEFNIVIVKKEQDENKISKNSKSAGKGKD
jgi:DNA-directed RNA polymerase subunit RPC12/RpoP